VDEKDREILDILQQEFPLAARPWAVIAEKTGLSEQEVVDRVGRLKEAGIIRRIGGVFDSRSLGFYSTLCAARVPEGDIDRVAGLINACSGVTHNYLRDDEYNLWFTLTAPSEIEAREYLTTIEEAAGITIVSLPATKVYKIQVTFAMGDEQI